MSLHYLTDVPHFIPTIAYWHYQQWPALFKDEADAIREFSLMIYQDRIPFCLVEMENEEPLGTAALLEQDMDNYPTNSPWLACVYVSEKHRGKGIGKNLVQAAVEKARELSYPSLYLWTDKKKKFYEKMGWLPINEMIYKTYPVTVMTLNLNSKLS